MPAHQHLPFPQGTNLADELLAAMKRIAARGVTYPEGYYAEILAKYTLAGIDYPHILMIIGQPRINTHFFYSRVLENPGRLLDYGCGTGDNVRQLLRDNFPKDNVTAFDICRGSIDLGFDLYRDREEIGGLFLVVDRFPFGAGSFDLVYSASVIHVITDDRELEEYLAHAYATLRPGGFLFGSTAGKTHKEELPSPRVWGPARVLTEDELAAVLTGAGFTDCKIISKPHPHTHTRDTKNQCIFEFCAEKPAGR